MKRLIKNFHLIISIIIVIPTAFIYGSPKLLSQCLDIEITTIDLSNMFKAIMCLYIGISLIWSLGIWNNKYWTKATELNILFMLTLASGRFISMTIDGFPTNGYIFAIIAEFSIGIYSLYQLKKNKN